MLYFLPNIQFISSNYQFNKSYLFTFQMGKNYRQYSKTSNTPRRPFEKDRLDRQQITINRLQIIGKYGLKNKREVWRVQFTLAKIRKAARQLLTLEPNDPRRIFEGIPTSSGNALLRRMQRYGLLIEHKKELDHVLELTLQQFMDRRLQTILFRANHANTIHEARVKIRQRHIKVGKTMVDVPSYLVRSTSQGKIGFATTSPFGGGRPGRFKRKKLKSKNT